MPATTIEAPTELVLYQSILHGSLDAGLLVDGSDGSIVYTNSVARGLFETTKEQINGSIDNIVSFWTHSLPQANRTEDTIYWKDVVGYAQEQSVREWTISGKTLESQKSFPAVAKLTPLPSSDSNNNVGTFWLIYVRHADHHEVAQGIYPHQDSHSQTQSGSRRNRRSSRSVQSYSQSQAAKIQIDSSTGTILHCNDKAIQSLSRLCKKGMIGKHISEIDWSASKEKSTFSSLDGVLENNMNDLANNDISNFTLEFGNKNSSTSSNNNHENNNLDTTTTTGATQQQLENITEAVFEAALSSIFQIDEHGIIQMVNTAAIETFGWKRTEFLGSNISMICGGEHGPKHASYLARYLATGDTRVIGKNRELLAKKKNGTEFPIELGVVEVDTFAGDTRLFCGFVRDLTAIQNRERMTEEIVEAALDPMFQINQSGKIRMVNQAALARFGYERHELLGQNVSLICGGSHGKHHDAYLKRYLRTGKTHIIGKYRELPARCKDGTEFPIQLAVVELKCRGPKEERMFVGFIHDLTNRKRNNDIIMGTIDASLDPVFHVDVKGIIQRVNRAALDHLGWTRSELIGQNVSMVVGGEHAKHHDEYIRRYLETGEAKAMGRRRKLMARRQDGSEMPIELKLSEINIDDGKDRMFCAFLTDLSKRNEE